LRTGAPPHLDEGLLDVAADAQRHGEGPGCVASVQRLQHTRIAQSGPREEFPPGG